MAYLFPNFMASDSEYMLVRAFWETHVWNSIPKLSRSGWSTPWLMQLSPTLEGGNPIFSAWNRKLKIGLKIVQVPLEEGGDELSRWVEWLGGDVNDPDAVRTLVVVCILTDMNAALIKDWMQEWIEQGRIVDHVELVEMTTSSDYSSEVINSGPY